MMEGEKGVGRGAVLGVGDPDGELSPATKGSSVSSSSTLEDISDQRVRWKREEEPTVEGGRRVVFGGSEIASLRRSPYECSISISSLADRYSSSEVIPLERGNAEILVGFGA